MKLLAVALYNHRGPEVEPVCLGLGAELSSFGYFQRSSVKEMLAFLSKTIVQRTAAGQRQTVRQEDYFCHVHVKDGGIAGVAVTDRDYPTIAAFSVVGKVLEEFLQQGDESWRTATADTSQALAVAESCLAKYQVGAVCVCCVLCVWGAGGGGGGRGGGAAAAPAATGSSGESGHMQASRCLPHAVNACMRA
jgi:hypothetical protein